MSISCLACPSTLNIEAIYSTETSVDFYRIIRHSEVAESHIRKFLDYVQLKYLDVTVEEKLRSGWAGPFLKVEGCCD
jgi:hypothetical protein